MHVDRLINSHHLVDRKLPEMYRRLPPTQFFGIGPKQSLDEKISFINENNNLARRIIDVGRRKEFITGLSIDSNRRSPEPSSHRRSLSVQKESGHNYLVGSLNKELRRKNQDIIIKSNNRFA